MNQTLELLNVVALLNDVPGKGLRRGQVGTLVEQLDKDVWEVEFCAPQGRTYAQCALRGDQLMVLHHAPAQSA